MLRGQLHTKLEGVSIGSSSSVEKRNYTNFVATYNKLHMSKTVEENISRAVPFGNT